MQTIGEKIEETRKRKGISLSEAAEATKIRSDFLHNIETNQYDYDLPDIYKRGFIKNYARYLKLNPEKILAQYQEQQITQTRRSKKGNSELFGSNFDLNTYAGAAPSEGQSADAHTEKPSLGTIHLKKPSKHNTEASAQSSRGPAESTDPSQFSNRDLYIKTALVGLCTLIFVLLVIWFIQNILKSPETLALSEAPATTENRSLPATDPSPVTSNEISEITIKADGTVYVIVRQHLDNKTLLKKRLMEGEIQTLKRRGPVDIAFTKGNLLRFITDDARAQNKPETDGPGRITVP
tara:strand:+ start:173 stop:1054 length:882 start_codon:yes stop_codon:yes gene_type:complete